MLKEYKNAGVFSSIDLDEHMENTIKEESVELLRNISIPGDKSKIFVNNTLLNTFLNIALDIGTEYENIAIKLGSLTFENAHGDRNKEKQILDDLESFGYKIIQFKNTGLSYAFTDSYETVKKYTDKYIPNKEVVEFIPKEDIGMLVIVGINLYHSSDVYGFHRLEHDKHSKALRYYKLTRVIYKDIAIEALKQDDDCISAIPDYCIFYNMTFNRIRLMHIYASTSVLKFIDCKVNTEIDESTADSNFTKVWLNELSTPTKPKYIDLSNIGTVKILANSLDNIEIKVNKLHALSCIEKSHNSKMSSLHAKELELPPKLDLSHIRDLCLDKRITIENNPNEFYQEDDRIPINLECTYLKDMYTIEYCEDSKKLIIDGIEIKDRKS